MLVHSFRSFGELVEVAGMELRADQPARKNAINAGSSVLRGSRSSLQVTATPSVACFQAVRARSAVSASMSVMTTVRVL